MTWTIEFERAAAKEFRKLDPKLQRRIQRFFQQRILPGGDPRSHGKALRGAGSGKLWRYRVGSCRVIAEIEDDRLVILIVRVGHRSQVYR